MAQGGRGPDLNSYSFCTFLICFRYIDKRLNIKLNADRRVAGVLRGFDNVNFCN